MEILQKTVLKKASKQHICNLCGCEIHKGENYLYAKYKDGDIYSWKMHKECSAIVNILNMHELCEDGVTSEDFKAIVTDEYMNLMSKFYNREYESRGFVYPAFKEQMAFVANFKEGLVKFDGEEVEPCIS